MNDEMGGPPLKDIPFVRYFRESKLLHAGLFFNLIWYASTVGAYAYLYSFGLLTGTIFSVDFGVFARASELVWTSPDQLYVFDINGLPYRYFPSFAFIMTWTHLIPLPIAYVFQVSLMFVANFLNLFLTYRLCQLYGLSGITKNLEKTLLFTFIAPQHFVNMILGQVSQLFILAVLLSLLALEHSRQAVGRTPQVKQYFVAGCLIGLAANVKPFALIFAPFLMPARYTRDSRLRIKVELEKTLAAALGLVLTLLPNIIFFWAYPGTASGFLNSIMVTTLGAHSTSITRLAIVFFPILNDATARIVLMAALVLPLFLLSYERYLRASDGETRHVYFFSEMLFLLLIVYPDSWFLFLAIWYAILGPSLLVLYNTRKESADVILVDRTWTIANSLLGYFAVGVVFHYLVLGFDPVIPPLLVAAFYFYERALRSSNRRLANPLVR